jgi:hypothetical protein
MTLVALALVLLVGSGVLGQDATPSGATRRPLDTISVSGLVWLDDGTLATSHGVPVEPGTPSNAPGLWRLSIGNGTMEPMEPAGHDECVYTAYRAPVPLSGGLIGTVRECGDPTARPLHYPTTVVVVDPGTGAEEQVADFADLDMERSYLPITPTYHPGSDIGMAAIYGGVCSGLVWLGEGGVRPVDDVFVGEGDKRFALGAQVRGRGSEACEATGQAAWPDIAPDGSRIAFLASPDSVGVPISDRWDLPFNLYVMPTDSLEPLALLTGLRHPRGVRWSPDGGSLLVSGELDGQGDGVWLVDAGDGSRRRVAPVRLGSLAWSSDGTAFAGLYTPLPADGSVPTTTDLHVVPVDDLW